MSTPSDQKPRQERCGENGNETVNWSRLKSTSTVLPDGEDLWRHVSSLIQVIFSEMSHSNVILTAVWKEVELNCPVLVP